jgi:phosphoglycolate phosphatase-like HAD superfamily hydrolase
MFEAVLFDLDGTLADTAPDLGGATNILLLEEGRPQHSLETLRPYVSQGVRGLLKAGFGIDSGHPDYERLSNRFLEIYAARICDESQLFSGIPELLDALEDMGLQWGIVTNKRMRFTDPLVELLALSPVRPASSAVIRRPNPNLRLYRFCMPANCSTARRNTRFMSVTTCVTFRPATQPVV